MLERSVVSIEAGSVNALELHEMNKDSCFIKVRTPPSEFSINESRPQNLICKGFFLILLLINNFSVSVIFFL